MSSSVSNNALKTPEILHEVFMNLSVQEHPAHPFFISRYHGQWCAENRKALLNAALSCKFFLEPALDALWWRLKDIASLFLILPAIQKIGGAYVLNGPVHQDQLGRFDRYARRIRHLIHDEEHGERVDPSVYVRIHQLRKHTPILPRLLSLSAAPTGPNVLYLLSPALRSVCVEHPCRADAHSPVVWVVLDALSDTETYPNLTKLYVEPVWLSLLSLQSFSRIAHLRDLDLTSHAVRGGIQDLGLFTLLSSLRCLEQLAIEFLPTSTYLTHPSPLDSPFPVLQYLRVQIPTIHLLSLLSIFPSKGSLSSLMIKLLDGATLMNQSSWTKFFGSIASKFAHSLRVLSISCRDQESPLEEEVESSISTFEPLFDIRQLTAVSFRGFPWMAFDDEEFARFASAWKMAKWIRFPLPRYSSPYKLPPATISSLQSFALACPHLQGLSISFDACCIPLVEDARQPISLSGLIELDVGYSPVSDAPSVARHLDRIFPSLRSLRDSYQDKDWNHVRELLPMFRAVRADERTRRGIPN